MFISTPSNGSAFIDVTAFSQGQSGAGGGEAGSPGMDHDSYGGVGGVGGLSGDYAADSGVIAGSKLHLLISSNINTGVDGLSHNAAGTVMKSSGIATLTSVMMGSCEKYISGTIGTQTSVSLPTLLRITAVPTFITCVCAAGGTTIEYWDPNKIDGYSLEYSGTMIFDDGGTITAMVGGGSGVIYA